MTVLEVSEIFALWALNWPNAEMFRGGTEMLDLRCKLFAAQLSDVEFWDGMNGAALSLKGRKYVPSIAEFREDIQEAKAAIDREIEQAYLDARTAVRLAELIGESVEQAISGLPQRTQTVIRVMGGIDAFLPPNAGVFNIEGFRNTYKMLLRKRNALTGEKFEALPSGKIPNDK